MPEQKLSNETGNNTSRIKTDEIYPAMPSSTNAVDPNIDMTKVSQPKKSELLGLLYRILFLFAVSMMTGLLFGKYIIFSDRTLGDALSSFILAPVAILVQLLAFLVTNSFFKGWYAYPFLAALGIGIGKLPNKMLSGIFVPDNVAVGLQLFVAYLGLFSLIYIAEVLTKKRRPSIPALILLCSFWLVIAGLFFSMVAYTKSALLISVPVGENFVNDTVCVSGRCSKPDNNQMNDRFYTLDYNGTEGSYSARVALKRLKFLDTRKTDDNCQKISDIPDSDLRYKFQKTISGINLYEASVTRKSTAIPQEGRVYGPGESYDEKTYDVVTQYYCFVKDLYVYELVSFKELPDSFFQKLQAKVEPSELKLLLTF